MKLTLSIKGYRINVYGEYSVDYDCFIPEIWRTWDIVDAIPPGLTFSDIFHACQKAYGDIEDDIDPVEAHNDAIQDKADRDYKESKER